MAGRFAVDLPATVTFDYPTPAALAAYVHAALPASVAAAEPAEEAAWQAEQQPGGHGRGGGRQRRRRAAAAAGSGSNGAQRPRRSHAAVLQQLSELVARVLGQEVLPDVPLMEAGLDSLGAVELGNAVAAAFSLEVPATLVFDYPTLASLAAFVGEHAQQAAAGGDAGGQAKLLALSPSFSEGSEARASDFTALVAVSCRYPRPGGDGWSAAAWAPAAGCGANSGANANLAGFHAALMEGANVQALVPPHRWDADATYHPGAQPLDGPHLFGTASQAGRQAPHLLCLRCRCRAPPCVRPLWRLAERPGRV